MDPEGREFSLFVAGIPRPHQRPGRSGNRWLQRADRPHDMTWRATVRAAWLTAVGALAWSGPVALRLTFFGGTGDLSNMVKAVEDALGQTHWPDGLAPIYLDDRQVMQIEAVRYPAVAGDSGVGITATQLAPRKRPSSAWRSR